MNRATFLRVLNSDGVRWARRYGIEPFTHPCSECGREMRTSIPSARGQLRGLIAPVCACGNTNTPYCVVRYSRFGDGD